MCMATSRVLFVFALAALICFPVQAQTPEEPAPEAPVETASPPQAPMIEEPGGADTGTEPGLLQSVFITTQFGGGMMISAGGGFGFFDNIVRPELLLGFTPEGAYQGFTTTLKLNARIVRIAFTPEIGLFGTIGTGFTFFSGSLQVTSAAFVALEFAIKEILLIPEISLFTEADLYFVTTREGNLLFQLGIGLRAHVF